MEVQAEPHEIWPAGDLQTLLHSRFDSECEWMCLQKTVLAFARTFWQQHRALPALGQLHFLYNRDCHPGQVGLGEKTPLAHAEDVFVGSGWFVTDKPPPAAAARVLLHL